MQRSGKISHSQRITTLKDHLLGGCPWEDKCENRGCQRGGSWLSQVEMMRLGLKGKQRAC